MANMAEFMAEKHIYKMMHKITKRFLSDGKTLKTCSLWCDYLTQRQHHIAVTKSLNRSIQNEFDAATRFKKVGTAPTKILM